MTMIFKIYKTILVKKVWQKKMTEKNPRQITAQARLPQVTTSARKSSVGKYLHLALTTQWPLTGV